MQSPGDDIQVSPALRERRERVFGKRPTGVSICGTSGKDGKGLGGFDETDKSREEFEMLTGLGMRMINTRLTDLDGSRNFANYAGLGHPEVMGFPSGYSDTDWMYRKNHGDPVEYVTAEIKKRWDEGAHMPLMLHDWCAWNFAEDKELSHVVTFADTARACGYRLVTHVECYRDGNLWAG